MKIAILFVALLAFACAQNACMVFSCGSITSGEGAQTCVKLRGSNADTLYDMARCTTAGQVCQAWTWASPADVQPTAACGTTMYPTTWPTQFVAEAGAGKDGDICTATANCFTSAANAATCTSSLCTAATKTGSTCTVTDDCPRGNYCAGAPLVCTALIADDATCTTSASCRFRRSCIQLDGATGATCVAWGTRANGAKFTRPAGEVSSEVNAALTASDVCMSGFETTIGGVVQCRSGDRNKVQGRSSLAKATNGEMCDIFRFTSDSLTDFATGVAAQSTSKCGFNTDNRAWCPLLRGDDEVVNTLSSFVKAWNNIVCHKNSGTSQGSVCKAQQDAQGSKDGWKVFQMISQASDDQTFANTAMNDKCVAETVMANFWQGQFTSAYKVSAVTSLFVLIASLIY